MAHITHRCGHSPYHQISGDARSQSWQINRESQSPCDACHSASVAAISAERGLAELTGSPKQIAWANDIRLELLAIVDAEEADLAARAKTDEFREILADKAARIRGMTTAKYWIERKTKRDMAGRLQRNVVAEIVKRTAGQ